MDTVTITGDWVGRVIDGRFTLLEWLGGSERGGVFRTELEGPRAEKAAIKLIPADAAGAAARYSGWASSMKLSHPHLTSVFRFGRCHIDGTALIYAVTEFADEILSQVLPERAITTEEAGEMLEPVADTLSYLHGRGFVHGHLKPMNIMVVDNRLKISGDSLYLAGSYRKPASALGAYDAPELATRPISPAADLWSLGVTLIEALTRRAPASGQAALFESGVIASIPQPFADIARHCLPENPAHRWSADEVKHRLESDDAAPAAVEKTTSKPASGMRAAAIAGAALLMVIVLAFLLISHSKPRPASPAPVAKSSPAAPAVAPPPAQNAAPSAPQNATPPAPQSAAPRNPSPQAVAPSTPQAAAPTAPKTAIAPQAEMPATQGPMTKGLVAQRVLPDVSPKASATIHGKVTVSIRASVDTRGEVSDATFTSEGPSKYFARLALEAARQWRFQPAQSGGQPVPSVWILRFEFTPSGAEAIPLEQSP